MLTERYYWIMRCCDRKRYLSIEIVPVKLVFVKDIDTRTDYLNFSLAARLLNRSTDFAHAAILPRWKVTAQRQRVDRLNPFDDNIQRLQSVLHLNLAQAKFDLGEALLLLADALLRFGMFQPIHAANFFRRKILAQQLGDFFER